MKKIVFLMSRFLDGGIDTVLTEYLAHLSQDSRYRLTLAIGIDMGQLEVFRDRIPSNVEVQHLVQAPWLTRWRQQKIAGRLSFPAKLADEVLLSPLRRLIMGRRIARLAASHDVVIDFDCCASAFLQKTTTRKIAWFHFSFDESLRQNRRRTLRIARRLQRYDSIVTIAQSMKAEGERLFPSLAPKLVAIYNPKDRSRLLQKAAQPADGPLPPQGYLLAVERLEESQKDLSTLLRAYQLLVARHGHTEKLLLLGKGRSEEHLRQLAQELGIAPMVEFLGFKTNPYPWMRQARLLVHSAKFEGLPTVLVEGLMLDKLIVSADCPTGPREILADGRAGLLVPVGDAPAMAQALHQLLSDSQLQARLLQGVAQQQQVFSFAAADEAFARLVGGQ